MRAFFRGYQFVGVTLLSIVILLVVLEAGAGALRLMMRDKPHREIIRANWATLTAAQPGMTEDDMIEMIFENNSATMFVYEPWVQFRVPALTGRYVNTDGHRRSNGKWADWRAAMPDSAHDDVYFFGGSTTFGYGVQDSATIPAQFQTLAPAASKTRAFNYGQPNYYSRQETAFFELLLRAGHRPDVAVFIDGINESIEMTAAYKREPFFTALMSRRLSHPLDFGSYVLNLDITRALARFGLAPSLSQVTHVDYGLPKGIPLQAVVDSTFSNYMENMDFTRQLCATYKVKCLFVWQPAPMVDYNRPEDKLSQQGSTPAVTLLYQRARQLTGRDDFLDLSTLASEFKGPPYIDAFHYSGPFMQLIAQRIADGLHGRNSIVPPSNH